MVAQVKGAARDRDVVVIRGGQAGAVRAGVGSLLGWRLMVTAQPMPVKSLRKILKESPILRAMKTMKNTMMTKDTRTSRRRRSSQLGALSSLTSIRVFRCRGLLPFVWSESSISKRPVRQKMLDTGMNPRKLLSCRRVCIVLSECESGAGPSGRPLTRGRPEALRVRSLWPSCGKVRRRVIRLVGRTRSLRCVAKVSCPG